MNGIIKLTEYIILQKEKNYTIVQAIYFFDHSFVPQHLSKHIA